MKEKKSPIGIKISMAPLAKEGHVLSVPLYMVNQLARLCNTI